MSWGGQDSIGLKKEYHSQAKINREQIESIYKMLMENILSYDEISKKMNISKSELSNINLGKVWYEERLSYPLRKNSYSRQGQNNGTCKLTEEKVMLIRKSYVDLTVREIIKRFKDEFNISESTIRKICFGEIWRHLPIYKKKTKEWIKIETCID